MKHLILMSMAGAITLMSSSAGATTFSCATDEYTRGQIAEFAADHENQDDVRYDLTLENGALAGVFFATQVAASKTQIHTMFLCGASLNYFYVRDLNPKRFISKDETEFKSVSSYEGSTIHQDEGLVSLDFVTESLNEQTGEVVLKGFFRLYNLADNEETDVGTFFLKLQKKATRPTGR